MGGFPLVILNNKRHAFLLNCLFFANVAVRKKPATSSRSTRISIKTAARGGFAFSLLVWKGTDEAVIAGETLILQEHTHVAEEQQQLRTRIPILPRTYSVCRTANIGLILYWTWFTF